jgi:hypothetical protein
MTIIAAQLTTDRALSGAPRVTTLAPGYAEAAALACRHARTWLSLPAVVPILWVSHPGGHRGETWCWPDGRVEVAINAGADLSPRDVARVVLHELRHVAYGARFCARWPEDTEKSATDFPALVMLELAPHDFERLSGGRPSGRR